MAFEEDKYGFRFREWDIYKDARIFRRRINKILNVFPRQEKYALVDQTKRALNSIVLNIAESANKNTDKDMKVYINRAHCSLDEVISCLDCALDDGYITKEKQNRALQKASSLAKRLRGFAKQLSSSSIHRQPWSFNQGHSYVSHYISFFSILLSFFSIFCTKLVSCFNSSKISFC